MPFSEALPAAISTVPAPTIAPRVPFAAMYIVQVPVHFIEPAGNSEEALLHRPLLEIELAGVKVVDVVIEPVRPFPKQSKT